ncbi:hypothetical protein [Natrinema halophilum]|uniref:Uncharacterized protein n=1 Tax=Natrinema halophilum TaxID=1699371 RepID=A0A7D5GSZ8_9EURY|nr:hypothetical protein [Natrinema halophilum]QLG49689.1 hypothetical protein HYG82_12865 [Natrinema halophilum]
MAYQTGFTKKPELSVFMLVYAIVIIGLEIYFSGLDAILNVEDIWVTGIFAAMVVQVIVALSALAWVAMR